ncbi:uncharacterized protein Z518_08609 [Rhinocladiella mackenziei CBS 650.93]|uniref:Arylsulfotransferase n=1 Tax=Rhinocladiella mackenziei CBS 650.93 TaxID=1442369 RepID=A0A0D2FL33_9EURO|nr:uncharacterized protein Z518_08609 [Rhinocladiella mackenziei CBS 650.93]KIX02667.1 hypothetical protein Z518_08609 [Rhinocladiella mackenziei CBS 650.93]
MWKTHVFVQELVLASLLLFIASVWASPAKSGTLTSRLYNWGFFGPYPQQHYKSFQKSAPLLNFAQWDRRCDNGYTFIGPRGHMVSKPGPVIMDSNGELVWIEDKYGQAMDFKVQRYKGRDYLTFWTGTDSGTFGTGTYLMLDSSYELYKSVSAANGLSGDLHEFKITDNGTALMTVYDPAPADLSSLGITSPGWIYDSIFQEVDIETGELLFEWRASDHYQVEESFHSIAAEERRPNSLGKKQTSIGRGPNSAWDFFHINSVDKDMHGNYIISSRYMHTVTCISPVGETLWILGGKRNQFTDLSMGAATNFSFQHHATMHENNTITIFDNGKYDADSQNAEYSRGLVISLDLEHMTAELVQDFVHPDRLLVGSQGSIQLLPDSGHTLLGWGYMPAYTEFDSDGTVLCDVHIAPSIVFGLGWVKSYRAFRTSTWVGKPSSPPDVYLRPRDGVLYVSWNGATEIDRWLLQGWDEAMRTEGDGEGLYVDLSSLKKDYFESSFEIASDMPTYLRVAALDRNGNVLGYSEFLDRRVGNAQSEIPQFIVLVAVLGLLSYLLWCIRNDIPGREKLKQILENWQHRRRRNSKARELLLPKEEPMHVRPDWDEDNEFDIDVNGDPDAERNMPLARVYRDADIDVSKNDELGSLSRSTQPDR